MRRGVFAIAALMAVVLGATGAAAADAPAKTGSVVFSKLAEQLPVGSVWFTYQTGLICITRETLKADGVMREHSASQYGPIFMREMAGAANVRPTGRPNLFENSAATDDERVVYEVGGLVHGMDLKVCTFAYEQYDGGAKGQGVLQIEWQVYSRAKRQVVATIQTTGRGVAKRGTSRNAVLSLLLNDAFADAVRQLGASPEFRTLLDAPPPKDELRSDPGKQLRISMPTGRPAARSMGEADGSVVMVLANGGHGSGVLVSTDGYILTNEHVVGQEKTVKIRWSDRLETVGEVIRLHKARDVALIKTDPRGRQPISVRSGGAIQLGDAVFAIGAPLDQNYQGTVTRGVVSANRIMDGYSFIQSDVAINLGNSGGPLLDEKGFLVGLTDLSYQPAERVQIGINFFIPIKDALDFLSIDLMPDTAEPPPATKASTPVAGGRVSSR